ncbi:MULTISPECIES: hypothetical protein [unclassified Psychrobacter]|uniref:hypothetical protein n=1 Tax=unclassified Psychrobacter TaxID=196806 RepID=UPI003FD09DFC
MSQSEQIKLLAPSLSVTNFNLPSLHLLYDEIIATLTQVERHLTEFNDHHDQAPLLLDSVEALEQLSCVFELISLAGGQVLSAAIAQGLQRIHDNTEQNDTALIMDLSEAIMTLDRYVEFVLLTETVEPTLLLPIINKLRAHSGADPIASDYFSAFGNSSVTIANPEQNFQVLDTLNLDSELLTYAYRSGLGVALLHQAGQLTPEDEQKLNAMSDACDLIAAHTDSLFWQAASAAVTDLAAIMPLSLDQKHTLIYLEQQFYGYLPAMDKRFADLVSFACKRDNAKVEALRKQYARNRLQEPQLEQMRKFLFGPNRALVDSLNSIIQDQINAIKKQVDDYARANLAATRPSHQITTTQITDDLRALSSALRLLGLSDAADSLDEAAAATANWQNPEPKDFDHLLLALVQAENAMIAMAEMHTPGAVYLPLNNPRISLHQLNSAYNTLVQESRRSIASAEQSITDYLADNARELSLIETLPTSLKQVAGAVRFLQLPASASMLNQLVIYLEERIAQGVAIEDQTLAHIADVIMAVDYHLDGFEHNRPQNKQALDVGQYSLSQLFAA